MIHLQPGFLLRRPTVLCADAGSQKRQTVGLRSEKPSSHGSDRRRVQHANMHCPFVSRVSAEAESGNTLLNVSALEYRKRLPLLSPATRRGGKERHAEKED